MFRNIWRITAYLSVASVISLCLWGTAHADTSDSYTYGSGTYGNCDYGACTLTLSSGGTTNIDVVPAASGKCTVQSDTVSVLTDSTSGYNLSMTTSGTNNVLAGPSASLAASSGTRSAPVVLATNTWGWRVDGLAGFGAGPASAQSSGNTPGHTFAGVPASNGTPAVIASSSGMANPAVNTVVWYGACADSTVPSGTYTNTVTYTAVTN